MTDETLLKHFNLLKQEFQKVNNKYQLLKNKYDQLVLLNGNSVIDDNFLFNLNKIIKGLYKDKKYSDITIKLQSNNIPGHRIVFEANGGDWCQSDLATCEEINLQGEDQFIGEQVVKWLYLQELNDNQSHETLWKILKVAHEHRLHFLKSRCEVGLTTKVTKDNYIYFYMKSSEFNVENLRNFCCDLIVANWNEYTTDDFSCLGASILLELLEAQSNFPLHAAVKANRDDVVFLYINENYSQLEELVNVINDEGEIVLDLALTSKRVELCQTLLANCANPNSVDNYGLSLLHKAILRCDEFSTCFLIQNGCHLNPLSPDLLQTPLQIIANLMPQTEDNDYISKMTKIATVLIQSGVDINHVDANNMTALCSSILSGNEVVLKAILESGRCTTVNGANSWCTNKRQYNKYSTMTMSNSHIIVPPLPLWLAICREYRPDLLKDYKDFKELCFMKISPTCTLIEYDADPSCLNDAETGNSIFLDLISRNMEDAAIFVLETFSSRQKSKSHQMSNVSGIETLVNMTNNFKESSLHMAIENELCRLCKLLFLYGADPNLVRRKTINQLNSLDKDDIFSSCESFNSITSLKGELEQENNNNDIKPIHNIASDVALSSWLCKGNDLNPFKDAMMSDPEDCSFKSNFQKNSSTPSSVDLDHLKPRHKKRGKSGSRIKSKKTNQDKILTVDLCTPTHLAIKTKNIELINLFVNFDEKNGCTVNWLMTDASGESPFTLTLWTGLISLSDKIFRKLVKNGLKALDIDRILIDGHHLLHLAVLKNNIEAVQFLITIGCDINIKTPSGATPLQLACEKFNLEIIKILCLAGADSNIIYTDNSLEKTTDPSCPLWVAIINNRFDIAEILTEAGADIDMWITDYRDRYEQTLLHRAILSKLENAANFLIAHDCDINSPRENSNIENVPKESVHKYTDGNNPLHMACQLGLESVVRNLLSRDDIEVDSQNINGHTVLHIAIQFHQEAILSYLLNPKFKMNLSIRDKQGHTPFHIAMQMSSQKSARAILKYHPQAADETDNLGRNFLHVAVQTMNREAVFFLIQVCANLNVRVKDAYKYTPLHLAIISGAPEDMVRSLILAGARIEQETIEKQNLLHLCVIYERSYLIGFLIENGASTTHQDHQFETPLHVAIRGGNRDIIESLLISSASVIRNKNLKGENILHILANNAKENAVAIFSLIMNDYPDFPVDEKDAMGNTALFLCAQNGHIRLGVSLLMKGASLGCINNDELTLFNCDNISETLLLKLLDSLDNEPNWLDGELCVSCISKFSLKNRKHHCRHCGRLICGKCSMNEVPIIKYNIRKCVRVCDVCFNFIVNGKCR